MSLLEAKEYCQSLGIPKLPGSSISYIDLAKWLKVYYTPSGDFADKELMVKSVQKWIHEDSRHNIPEKHICVITQALYSTGFIDEPLNTIDPLYLKQDIKKCNDIS